MSLSQQWSDAPSGAYQDHNVLEVFRQAVAQTIWLPYAKRMSISDGSTVTVPIRGKLSEPTSSALIESQSIPLDKLTITSKNISLTERGRGVMVTRKNMNRSPIDLLSEHKMALAEQMALDMDTVLEAAFEAGQLKYSPTGAAAYSLATNGSFGAAALSNANFFHIRKMRDLAFRTYLMPKLDSGYYAFIASTSSIRGILDDPEFLEINKNGRQEMFEKNLVGKIADVEIYEDNHALSDGIGTNSDVGEGIFIAKDAVYYAILQQPEIHFDSTLDHGRFTSIAWYGDWGAGSSTDSASAGLARLIHFGST